jgi:hypothetical protein
VAVSWQLLAFSGQLLAFSGQLLAVSWQRSEWKAVGYRRRSIDPMGLLK